MARKRIRGIELDGAKVAKARSEKKMSQEALANALDVDTATISRMERGKRVDPLMILEMTKILQVPYYELTKDGVAAIEPKQTRKVSIVITVEDGEPIHGLSTEDKGRHIAAVLHALGLLLGGMEDMRTTEGSIIINAMVLEDDAERIRTAFAAGELERLGITSVELRQPITRRLIYNPSYKPAGKPIKSEDPEESKQMKKIVAATRNHLTLLDSEESPELIRSTIEKLKELVNDMQALASGTKRV